MLLKAISFHMQQMITHHFEKFRLELSFYWYTEHFSKIYGINLFCSKSLIYQLREVVTSSFSLADGIVGCNTARKILPEDIYLFMIQLFSHKFLNQDSEKGITGSSYSNSIFENLNKNNKRFSKTYVFRDSEKLKKK